MLIHLHKQATTTPKVRAAIQASDDAGTVLAERYGVTPQTVYKWRKRDSVEDRSHTPHRLQTTLTPAQEAVAVSLRKTLLVSLDDLLAAGVNIVGGCCGSTPDHIRAIRRKVDTWNARPR